jgi:stage II sporulation SpoAA-like protein
LTKDDYEQTVEPLQDDARRHGPRIRLLLQIGPEYRGFTTGAAWEKVETGLRSPSMLRQFDGYALVTDLKWIREWTYIVGFLLPIPLRVFGNQQRDEAIAWLSSLPEHPGVSHRLLSESGVVVVEVTPPLRAQDFDALAVTADTWLETHDALPGVVVHVRGFPGWENVGGLLRHIRFVRDHRRRVRRVALAADGKLASLAPRLAEHFVKPGVKGFGYDELDKAVAWAAGPSGGRPATSSAGTSAASSQS